MQSNDNHNEALLPEGVTRSILFVDGDNMLESAVLEALMQYEVDKRGLDISVSSVGVDAVDGKRRSEIAYGFRLEEYSFEETLDRKYYRILRSATRQMTRERLEAADLIVVLPTRCVSAVKEMLPPSQWGKVVLFHLYCLGNRSEEFPERVLRDRDRRRFEDFKDACRNLITRIISYPYFETILEPALERSCRAFVEKYERELTDGFGEEEQLMEKGDRAPWLRLQRLGDACYLDLVIKDLHNSSSIDIVSGTLADIRQTLHNPYFARDYAMAYDRLTTSYRRIEDD